MGRITAPEVKEIISTEIADDVLETNFIETANMLVDGNLKDKGLSKVVLEKVELYLAAHFVALTEERGGIVRSSLGDAAETYSDVYEQGLKSTRFGQTALALDTSGTLNRISSVKLRAELRIV